MSSPNSKNLKSPIRSESHRSTEKKSSVSPILKVSSPSSVSSEDELKKSLVLTTQTILALSDQASLTALLLQNKALILPPTTLVLPTRLSTDLYTSFIFDGPDQTQYKGLYTRQEKTITFNIFSHAGARLEIDTLERYVKAHLRNRFRYSDMIITRDPKAQFDHAVGTLMGLATGTRAHSSINKRYDPAKGAPVPALVNTAKKCDSIWNGSSISRCCV